MPAHIDTINSGGLRRTADGYEADVEALVTDVSGDIWARRLNALRTPGLPAFGSQHPAEPTLFLLEQDVQPVTDSPSKFLIRLGYRPRRPGEVVPTGERYGPTQWSGDATTYTEDAYQDVNGAPMLVGYRGRPTQLVIDAETGQVDETVPFVFGQTSILNIIELATAQVDRPTTLLRAERWERDDPEPAAERIQGHTNRAAYRGKASRTLLCRAVRWQPQQGGGFSVNYEFAHRPTGWQVRAAVSYQGKVPDDATEGNGIARYDVLPAADFASLQL